MANKISREQWQALKSLPPETVFRFLGLEMRPTNNPDQLRGPCPVCKRGGDRALSWTHSIKMWACQGMCPPHPGKKALVGDLVALVAHARGIKQIPAAELMLQEFMREPEKPKASKSSQRRSAKLRGAPKPSKAPVGGTEFTIVDYLQQFS